MQKTICLLLVLALLGSCFTATRKRRATTNILSEVDTLSYIVQKAKDLKSSDPAILDMLQQSVQRLKNKLRTNLDSPSLKTKATPQSSLGQQYPCTTEIYNFWTWSGSLCASCEACVVSYGGLPNLMCRPCNNYTFTTGNTTVTNYNRVSNYGDGVERGYFSDCPQWAPAANPYNTSCRWAVECDRNYYNSFGFNCSLYQNRSSYTPSTNCVEYSITSQPWGSPLYANCTVCNQTNSSGQVSNSWVKCYPTYNYTFHTMDYNVHSFNISNSSSDDGIQRYFDTDCNSSNYTNTSNCRWCTTCTKNYWGSQGFQCAPCYLWTNTTNNCVSYDYYAYDYKRGVSLQSNCEVCKSSSGSKSISCSPVNYYYATGNYRLNNFNLSNSSSPSYSTQYFTTDCNEYNYDALNCNWITACSPSYYTSSGYNCWLYANGTNNSTGCTSFNSTSTYDYNRQFSIQGQCTACNNTSGSSWVDCYPLNYNYKTSDYSTHSFNISNSSAYDYISRYFTSDCKDSSYGSLNCGWVTRCQLNPNYASYSRGYQCVSYSNFTGGSDPVNNTNKVFKISLDYGLEWCGNCTRAPNNTVSCNQCTSWTNFTNSTCKQEVRMGETWRGEVGCSNCTVCNDGYFSCGPCRSSLSSAAPTPVIKAPAPKSIPAEVIASRTSKQSGAEQNGGRSDEETDPLAYLG